MTTSFATTAVFVLPARLTTGPAADLRPRLLGHVRDAQDELIRLDASDVEATSSEGLGLLVAASVVAHELGKELRIERPSEPFRRSIALMGFAERLEVEDLPSDRAGVAGY